MEAKRQPRLDRYDAAIAERSWRPAWIVLLLVLACIGLGQVLWHHASPGRDAGETAGEAGSISRILSVRGGVEYRSGDHGAWQQARSGVRLTWGDWVKSADDGRAEIRFPDGSIYVLPPATVGRLKQLASVPAAGGEAVADIDFQWVEVDESAAASAPAPPPGPQLVSPASDQEIDLATQKRLRLAWERVPAAHRYALSVSSSPSFASNIIEDDDRHLPAARIGIRRAGVFYWRVAAVGSDGSRGAWSEIRSFRVTDPGRMNRG